MTPVGSSAVPDPGRLRRLVSLAQGAVLVLMAYAATIPLTPAEILPPTLGWLGVPLIPAAWVGAIVPAATLPQAPPRRRGPAMRAGPSGRRRPSS